MPAVVMLIIIILTLWLTVAVVKRKQGNVRFWVTMAILFGPFVLPFLFFVKPESKR